MFVIVARMRVDEKWQLWDLGYEISVLDAFPTQSCILLK